MREILFKAKRIDNGEWIYGYLIQSSVLDYQILGFDEEQEDDVGELNQTADEIDPETVCQYTGLNDKNGVKIFEGDIVKYGNKTGYIVFHIGCFCVQYEIPDYLNRDCPAIDIIFHEYPNEVEVIGNIYDKDGDE